MGYLPGVNLENLLGINVGSKWGTISEVSGDQSGDHTQVQSEKHACDVMAFGTVVTGGYRSCPTMQRGTTVTTGLTAIIQTN